MRLCILPITSTISRFVMDRFVMFVDVGSVRIQIVFLEKQRIQWRYEVVGRTSVPWFPVFATIALNAASVQ